jgi:hypothetical protein
MLEIGAEVVPAERASRASATLAQAVADQDLAALARSEIGPGSREIREIPVTADVVCW